MALPVHGAPVRGAGELTDCARTPPGAVAGGIQPHGAMLVVCPGTFDVLYASANIGMVTGYGVPVAPGLQLADIIGRQAAHDIRNAAAKAGGTEIAGVELGLTLAHGSAPVDVSVHRFQDRVFIEFEPSAEGGHSAKDALDLTQALIRRIGAETGVEGLAATAARLVRSMLGYDRVMVCRFLHNGAGRVIAEAMRGGLPSFIGQHFPASDIPCRTRRLYELNPVWMIGNASGEPVSLRPLPGSGDQPLDLSFAQLRAVSPSHCAYLQNIGVQAALTIAVIVDGALWGLISCHHYRPRVVPMPLRIGADLFGRYFSLQIAIAERRAQTAASGLARERLDRVLADVANGGTLAHGLRDHLPEFATLIDCQGVGLWHDHEWSAFGLTPARDEALALVTFLAGDARPGLWHTDDIGRQTGLAGFGAAVAGVLAIPLSATPRDYLMIFRSEEAHKLEWAGAPLQPPIASDDGDRLTPHGSFATWREDVRGQCTPWTTSDLAVGEAIRTGLRDIFLKHDEASAEERGRMERRRRVLNDELNHRVKNIIALVKSIATQTGAHADSVAEYSASLEGRLRALAFAHDQSLGSTSGGDLGTLIEAEAALHRYTPHPERVVAGGDTVFLNDRAFGVAALVIHELMTNAAKYGSLSVPQGRLAISWSRDPIGACEIRWTESGGPPVVMPTRSGFGSKLVQTTMVHDLGGRAEVDYTPAGVTARLSIPARHCTVAPEQAAGFPASVGPEDTGTLAELAVLLVEDQSLIALDTEELLRGLGAREVRIAPDAAAAMRTLGNFRPDAAVLDFNLGEDTCEKVADYLIAHGVPFVFATGYGDSVMIPDHLRDVPVVRKPMSDRTLAAQLDEARRRSA